MPECSRCHTFIPRYSDYCDSCKHIVFIEQCKHYGLSIGDTLYVLMDQKNKTHTIMTITDVKETDIYGYLKDSSNIETKNDDLCKFTLYDLGKNLFFEVQDIKSPSYRLKEKYIDIINSLLVLVGVPTIKNSKTDELLSKYEPQVPTVDYADIHTIVDKYKNVKEQKKIENSYRVNNHNGEYFARLDVLTHFGTSKQKKKNQYYLSLYISKHPIGIECKTSVEKVNWKFYAGLTSANTYNRNNSLLHQIQAFSLRYLDSGNIIDWRSPIAELYYKKQLTNAVFDYSDSSNKSNMDMRHINSSIFTKDDVIYDHEALLKRQFESENKFTDQYIYKEKSVSGTTIDEYLLDVIQKNKNKNELQDIILTIQENQYEMIQTEIGQNLIVQGCAGSGKSMILLHRLSYILYNYDIVTSKIRMVTPNKLFNKHISPLLRTLELEEIKCSTFDELVDDILHDYNFIIDGSSNLQVGNVSLELNDVIVLGYSSYKKLQENAMDYIYNDTLTCVFERFKLLIKQGKNIHQSINIAKEKVENIIDYLNDIKGIYDKHGVFVKYIKQHINIDDDKTSFLNIDELFVIPATEDEIKKYKKILQDNNAFFTKDEFQQMYSLLDVCCEEVIDFENIRKEKDINYKISDKKYNNINYYEYNNLVDASDRAKMHIQDCSPYFFYKEWIASIPKNETFDGIIQKYLSLLFCTLFFGPMNNECYEYIFVDEGQEVSFAQYRLIKIALPSVIFNIYGDINQRTNIQGIKDWGKTSELINAKIYSVNDNYRNTNQITEFCNKTFNFNMAPIGLDGEPVKFISAKDVSKIAHNFDLSKKRVAIICSKKRVLDRKDTDIFTYNNISKGKVSVVYVDDIKGIEFDIAFVIEEGMNDNEKYIAYTRALSELYIVKNIF